MASATGASSGAFQVFFRIVSVGPALIGELRSRSATRAASSATRARLRAPRGARAALRARPPRRQRRLAVSHLPRPVLNLYVGQEFVVGRRRPSPSLSFWPDHATPVNRRVNFTHARRAPFTFEQADSLKTPLKLKSAPRSTFLLSTSLRPAGDRQRAWAPYTGYGREAFRMMFGRRATSTISVIDTDGDGIPDSSTSARRSPKTETASRTTTAAPTGSTTTATASPTASTPARRSPGRRSTTAARTRDGDRFPDTSTSARTIPAPRGPRAARCGGKIQVT